eukprot:SAG31_NODE_535_length_14348_cov_11.339603_15_plen_89_part_00
MLSVCISISSKSNRPYLQNSADDLLSLFMFLEYSPFSSAQKFHEVIGGKKKRDGHGREALKVNGLLSTQIRIVFEIAIDKCRSYLCIQ